MINTFICTAQINKKQFNYTELKVKHLKTLYKCLISDNPAPETLLLNLNNICKKITNLSKKEINSLNFIDYFLFLLELRCTSIGNTVFAEFSNIQNTKIEINLINFINKIKFVKYNELLKKSKIDNIIVGYKLPSVEEIITLNKNKDINSFYHFFISYITLKNKTIYLTNLSSFEILSLLKQLPAKVTSFIIKRVSTIINKININLFAEINGLQEKNLFFNFNILNLIYVLKFIFGEQLMSLYDNIFALCKVGNFSPEYIENCSPGEYIVFVKRLEDLTTRQKQQSSNTLINLDISDEIPL